MNEEDNIEAAMDKLAETLEPTRKSNTGSQPGEPAQKQVLIRATDYDHQRWKDAAAKRGVSIAEFVRQACNDESSRELDCTHPMQYRVSYPWSERCKRCGTRLR